MSDPFSRAATLDEPLLEKGPGDDVRKLLSDLRVKARRVRRLESEYDEESASAEEELQGAKELIRKIDLALGPPNGFRMTRAEQRDFRSCVAVIRGINIKSQPLQNSTIQHISASPSTNSDDEEKIELAQRQSSAQLLVQDEGLSELDIRLEEERARDIENINQRVSVVNQIYHDIASLVSNQQEEVDTIEAQISNAHNRTNKAQTQLVRANNRKSAKMKCCFYFAIALAIFATILIIAIIGFKNVAAYTA